MFNLLCQNRCTMSGLIASLINKDLSLLFYGDFSLCSSDQQFYSFSSYFAAKSRWSKQTRSCATYSFWPEFASPLATIARTFDNEGKYLSFRCLVGENVLKKTKQRVKLRGGKLIFVTPWSIDNFGVRESWCTEKLFSCESWLECTP